MSDAASDLILSLSKENTQVFNESIKLKEEITELKKEIQRLQDVLIDTQSSNRFEEG